MSGVLLTTTQSYLEKFMKKHALVSTLAQSCLVACVAFAAALASSAVFAETVGGASFVTEGRTYLGNYSTADKRISVHIDGLTYKGHYASHGQDMGTNFGNSPTQGWGRAFLFASSADVLRCQLDAEFPKARGQCQGADGRVFLLTSGT